MVLLMGSPLDDTMALLAAATDPKISSRRIRWEAMERVIRILRGSLKESDGNALAEREVRVAQAAWTWVRFCMDGPVPPGHPSTGIQGFLDEARDAVEVLQSRRVASLIEAVERVAISAHAAANEVARSVSASTDAGLRVVLIVRGEGGPAVREWAKTQGLSVDVVTSSEARRSAPWDHAFVFGPPERYSSSPWLTGPQAAATAGWLISAPPAARLTMMSWTGHRPLAKSGYEPWMGAPSFGVLEDSTVEVVEDYFLPESLDDFRPVAAPKFSDEDDLIDALGLQFLAEGSSVLAYFHPDVGPRPIIVTFEDGHAALSRMHLQHVEAGRCLLFRTSIAGKDALDRATAEWLAENRKKFPTAEAERLRGELKEATRRLRVTWGAHELVERFRSEGIDRDYAANLSRGILQPDFIAPLRQDTYLRVCRALELRPDQNAFSLLKTLRVARQQAGLRLAARTSERLGEIADIADALRDHGALVLRDAGLEGVALLIVRSVDETLTRVPESRLGTALTRDGAAWHP